VFCQGVEFGVAEEGEVFEGLGGVASFGPLGERGRGPAHFEEVLHCEGGGEDGEGGYCVLER